MGSASCKSSNTVSSQRRILMLGLDASGKTTILYKLKLDEYVTTIPTIGFNVETINYCKKDFTLWDVGGQDKIRPLWRHYYVGTQGVIFVIDSNDTDRIGKAKEELKKVLSVDDMKDAALLILANKQDLPNAMNTSDMAMQLDLHSIDDKRQWYIQSCSAISGDGLEDGLIWLNKAMPVSTFKHKMK